ncbi:MAG TPA: hypothetical protein VJZ71_09300 [Phycisphaerae bacterium]|nr:hypothetical protein [Phycisphaerae bacterium]
MTDADEFRHVSKPSLLPRPVGYGPLRDAACGESDITMLAAGIGIR